MGVEELVGKLHVDYVQVMDMRPKKTIVSGIVQHQMIKDGKLSLNTDDGYNVTLSVRLIGEQ